MFSRLLSKSLIRKRKEVKIISMVRNPIESMVSFFARSHFGDRSQEPNSTEGEKKTQTTEEISRQFTEEFLEKHLYRHHLHWFETEFNSALGIDFSEHAFNKKEGFGQFQEGPCEVLLLRTELSDEQKALRISGFLDLTDFSILRATRSTGKQHGTPGSQAPYAEQYKLLKNGLTIPKKYLDEIIDSKYAKHFFTVEYLEEMRQQYGC